MTTSSTPDENTPNSNELSNDLPLMSDSERILQLLGLVESLRAQLADAEATNERLITIVDKEAEDLQPFADNWFRPSAIVSITRDSKEGILMNGSPIYWRTTQDKWVSEQMRTIAEQINSQNAEKRAKARQK